MEPSGQGNEGGRAIHLSADWRRNAKAKCSVCLRNLLRKHTVEQALDRELRSSVEILLEEKMKDGLSRSVALRQALIELGGVEQVKEEVRAIR